MYAHVNGTTIFFDIDGAGVRWNPAYTDGEDRPVMVLLPGGPGASHLTYKNPINCFSALRDVFQIVYVDWRGTGRSDPDVDPRTCTMAQAVADVDAIREVLGIERWVVAGGSAGGMWSLCYATTHPDRVTHLIPMQCPGWMDGFPDLLESIIRRAGIDDERAVDVYRKYVGGELIDTPVEEWADILNETTITFQQNLYMDREKHPEAAADHLRRYRSEPRQNLIQVLSIGRWYFHDFIRNYRPLEKADRITCPTLVITGANDPIGPPEHARAIHEAIAGSELYLHPGGHLPLGEEQAAFLERIAGFLARNGIDAGALSNRSALAAPA